MFLFEACGGMCGFVNTDASRLEKQTLHGREVICLLTKYKERRGSKTNADEAGEFGSREAGGPELKNRGTIRCGQKRLAKLHSSTS